MHGSYRYSEKLKTHFAEQATLDVAAGKLKTVENGAILWAFDTHETAGDRNIAILNRFRDEASSRGEVFQCLRDLPIYKEIGDVLNFSKCADIYSRGFAEGISGNTITVAADHAKPDDFFRIAELPVLLADARLEKVRRLSPAKKDGEPDAYSETIYDSVADWLKAQREQWFESSLKRSADMKASCVAGGGRWMQALATNAVCAEGEMLELSRRFKGAAQAALHGQRADLQTLDRTLWEKGRAWINDTQNVMSFYERLRPILNSGPRNDG